MENSLLKNKFKTFIQKTEKLKLDFNKPDGSSSEFGGKIPPEWAKLIAVSPAGSRRDEGVFVASGDDCEGDEDVLSGMEASYFTEGQFDPNIFEMEGLEVGGNTTEVNLMMIDNRRKHLLKQLKVVTRKAYSRILEKRGQCAEELTKITDLDESMIDALKLCKESRMSLEDARARLAESSLGMLSAVKRRQRTQKLLQNLTIIATLQKTDVRLQELLSEMDYPSAIQLLLEVEQALKTYSHFTAIKQLSIKLQDTLEMTEEQLDVALSKVCCQFNADHYKNIQEAYSLMGKTQTSMDQLQMHVTSAVHNHSWNIVYNHANETKKTEADISKRAYQDVCSIVHDDLFLKCLTELCHSLCLLMVSYKKIVEWHEAESRNSDANQNIDKHLERQYVQRKLASGQHRMWQDVQTKVRVLVVTKEVGTKMNINDFMKMMNTIHKLIEFGHDFCGSESDTLQDSLKQECSVYFTRFHRQKLQEIKMHLENEGWEVCPVRSTFKLTQLKEFFEVSKSFNEDGQLKQKNNPIGTPSRRISSQTIQSLISPFQVHDNMDVTDGGDEDLFQESIHHDASDSENEDETELSQDAIIEDDETDMTNSKKLPKREIGSRSHLAPVVTNTSLMVLRIFGSYIHLMQMFRPIAENIFHSMTQHLEFYLHSVYSLFADGSKAESLSYFGFGSSSPRLQNLLAKIKEDFGKGEGDFGSFDGLDIPPLPSNLQGRLSNVETLNGLKEKNVAVESISYLAEQLKQLKKWIEQLVTDTPESLNLYYSQVLPVIEDLRRPLFWTVAKNSFSFDSVLQHINKVAWDIKEVRSQHSQYVDLLLRELQIFCIRLQDVNENHTQMSIEALKTLWELVILLASYLFVEGFSSVKKCSNEGRALMQLDYRQFVIKLETISYMKPLPHQDLVSNYIKAYYIQETELEEWVKQHTEYTPKQLLALINCVAYNNNKTKQKLNAIINEISTIKISLIKN